ncbi:DUF2278 family protein [Cellulomonas sp. P5_C6]
MPLKAYGVLAGRALASVREPDPDTPHFQVHLADDAGVQYRASINVKSQQTPSELLTFVSEDFHHPVTAGLAARPSGWSPIAPGPDGGGIDFIRGNLFDRAAMRLLPPDLPDADNDLADALDHHVGRAIRDPQSRVYLFGEPWGPETDKPDKAFGFLPGAGVHDIHMNQGNGGRFEDDDGPWQDGALLIHHAGADQWVAVFLAFQSQAWHTDDATGHALESLVLPGDTEPVITDRRVRVVASMVNGPGAAPEQETVTLVNVTAAPIDLSGWAVADAAKHRIVLTGPVLGPGEAARVPLAPPVQLGNGGGLVSVLDPAGLKVDGVAYTGADAHREGWTVAF